MNEASHWTTIKLECHAGVSGDMFVAALADLCATQGLDIPEITHIIQDISETIDNLEIVKANVCHIQKNGFRAAKLDLVIEERDDHGIHAPTIETTRSRLETAMKRIEFTKRGVDKARAFAMTTFTILADSESKAHGLDQMNHGHDHHVHLHELGSADTIIDILCVTKALDMLGFFNPGVQMNVRSTPVSVGRGMIHTAHGSVPVPAPGTLNILKSYYIPYLEGPVDGELATPTGVAILAALQPDFSSDSAIPGRCIGIGIGAGTKTFESLPNLLRIQLLESVVPQEPRLGLTNLINQYMVESPLALSREEFIQISVAIDDATPEDIGHLVTRSYDSGAREVFTAPVHLKKARVGLEITILCDAGSLIGMLDIWLGQSTSLGLRIQAVERIIIQREMQTIYVELDIGNNHFSGPIRIKVIKFKDNITRVDFEGITRPIYKIEHDDLVKVANTLGIAIHEARKLLDQHASKTLRT